VSRDEQAAHWWCAPHPASLILLLVTTTPAARVGPSSLPAGTPLIAARVGPHSTGPTWPRRKARKSIAITRTGGAPDTPPVSSRLGDDDTDTATSVVRRRQRRPGGQGPGWAALRRPLSVRTCASHRQEFAGNPGPGSVEVGPVPVKDHSVIGQTGHALTPAALQEGANPLGWGLELRRVSRPDAPLDGGQDPVGLPSHLPRHCFRVTATSAHLRPPGVSPPLALASPRERTVRWRGGLEERFLIRAARCTSRSSGDA
jgi:hypothetical protein